MTPLLVAKAAQARKAAQDAAPRLAWTTDTADAARRAARREAQRSVPQTQECPGCSGETSKSVGAMLGCTFCTL